MIDRIDRLDFTRFYNPPFTAALMGSTRSGKTTFLNYYVPKIAKKFDIIFLFSNSLKTNYEDIKKLPNIYTSTAYNEDIIKEMSIIQEKTSYKDGVKDDERLQILVIIDDEIDNKNAKFVEKLFCIMRNSNFSTIFSGQTYTFMKKSARNNINYLFLFKQNSMLAYEELYKIFFNGVIESKLGLPTKTPKYQAIAVGKDFLSEYTKNHNIIFLDILDDYNLYVLDKNYIDV